MPSRAELNLRARAVNVDQSSYANDSKLEQAVIYAEKNTAGDAVQATGTLTASGVFTDTETVTIGGYTYTVVDALTEDSSDAVAFEVLNGTAAVALDNLKLAINGGAGEGTNYSTGTFAHPDVTAGTNTDTTQEVTAVNSGTDGNSIATTETGANSAWGASTLQSGADGTYYVGEDAASEAQISGGANV